MESNLRCICMKLAMRVVGNEDEELLNAALVLFASMFVGRHAIKISKALEINRDFCCVVGIRMRHAGRWNNQIYKDWVREDSGDIYFSIDALIAVGDISGRTDRNKEFKIRRGSFMPRVA